MTKSTAVPRLSVFILELSELTHAHYREPVPLTPDLTKLMNICMKNLYFNQSSVFFVFHYLMVNTKPCTISIWGMRRWYFISVKCRSSVTILCFFQISSYSHTLHRVTVSIIRRQITRWRHNHTYELQFHQTKWKIKSYVFLVVRV